MTALAGGPHQGARTDVPVLATDTILLGSQPGSGYVDPPALVRRGDGQVLALTPLLYAVLSAVDGRRDLAAVAAAASEATGRTLLPEDASTLLDGKLRPLGLVRGADGSEPVQLARANPLLRLRPKFVVSRPELTRRITAPFAVLFHPAIVVIATLAFVAVAFWVLFVKGLASAAYSALHRPGLLLAVFAVTVVSAGFHEFGHAAALRRGGGTPGAMGGGLYLIWPAFYTDVTDSYRLSRRARLRTDLGGLYFNALVAVAMFGLWAAVRWDGLLLVIAAQLLQMVRQLPPFIRYDGYHILSDLVGVPDLFHRIGPTLRSFLPWRRREPAGAAQLKRWVRVVVALWVVLVVPLLLGSAALTVVALPRIVATTASSVRVQADVLGRYAGGGDWAGAGVKALAILALVVPVGGLLLMLVRVGRRYVVRTWRATRGRPAQRAVACVALAGVVAGLAYAWWPHNGNYRPLRPGERGTVQDALPGSLARALPGPFAPQPVAQPLRPGARRTVRTVWPAGAPLPTRTRPVLAVVLTPRAGNGPAWVFPFDRPAPPGPGDNQALAVVTKDGGSAYDVAFALVYATGNTVLNANEAYAFASCRHCTAVAVSFQVVLVVGAAHVVAPQNVSAAVSYDCFRCLAQALAVQLVVTVPGHLDAAQQQQLIALWSEIQRFGRHLHGLTLAQIRNRLASYEHQILAVVAPGAVASVSPSTLASTSTSTSGGGTMPSATPTAGTATPAPAPTGASEAPSPSGTASPAPSATTTATTTSTPEPTTTG